MNTPEPTKSGAANTNRDEPLFILDQKPDWLEFTIRAICGGLLGSLLATYLWYRTRLVNDTMAVFLLYTALIGASAFLAARHGDRYWSEVSNFFRRSP